MTKKIRASLALTALIGFGLAAPASLATAQQPGLIAAEQRPAPRAIQCSATLELMARAAPSWSSQAIAKEARSFWRIEAERLTQAAGRDTNIEISQEMSLQAEQAVNAPNALSERATLCLSEVPSAAPRQANQR